MPPEDKIQTLIFGGIMGTLASMVTAMLSKEENVWEKVKVFIAGVCYAILATFILMSTSISEAWRGVIIGAGSAFISTFWPMLGRLTTALVEKYIKKKSDDILPKP
jgi:O-antigen ligase